MLTTLETDINIIEWPPLQYCTMSASVTKKCNAAQVEFFNNRYKGFMVIN